MKEKLIIETKVDDVVVDDIEIPKDTEEQQAQHEQAVKFVESHRNILEHYARGSIHIAPSPEGLNTFAFDLEKNTIYINSMFYKNLGLSDERTLFASMHEIEHFLEKKQILGEKDGVNKFKKYLDRIKKSRAFALTDNCVADIHVNKTVISKTNEGLASVERGMYTEVLFKKKDFTESPRHIQFAQAILRESRVPDEDCIVADDVRKKLNQIKNMKGKSGLSLIDVMTSPTTTMSDRLSLQDRFIMPIIEELKEKDIEEEKERKKQKREQAEKEKEEGNKGGEDKSDKNKGDLGEDERPDTGDSEKGDKNQMSEGGGESVSEDFDPNEFWKKDYDEADKSTPKAVPQEIIDKAIEYHEKARKDKVKSEKEIQEELDKEYAENIGVKKEDLQKYRKLVKDLENVVNPETNRNVIEELRELIARIISKRKKKKTNPRYPVEDGEDLVEPGELVAEVKKGNFSPKVWETSELKEKQDNKFGELEISFIGDRSGSMRGKKLIEQQKSIVMAMEALKELADICKEERVNLTKALLVKSEIYSFQSSKKEDCVPIKAMSVELDETDRIKVASKLGSCEGTTTDFVPLETVWNNLDDVAKKKINAGELKKIVIVFTDGGSDDEARVGAVLEKLRNSGVVVVGIGITESGAQAITTYAPEARLAETAEKLPIILGDLLKEHLESI